MVNSSIIRPYVFSANSCFLRHALPIFSLPAKSFVSQSRSALLGRESSHRNKLPNLVHNDEAHTSKKLFSRGFGQVSLRNFSAGATHVNDAGSIDLPLIQSMEKKIKENLNAESVVVKDAYGDGRHVSIDVVASAFEGQSAVNRQRMVYKVIWEELQSTVHAVDQMTTSTPAEAAAPKDKTL